MSFPSSLSRLQETLKADGRSEMLMDGYVSIKETESTGEAYIDVDYDDCWVDHPTCIISIFESDTKDSGIINLNSYQLRVLAGYMNNIADAMDRDAEFYNAPPLPNTLQSVIVMLGEDSKKAYPRKFRRKIWEDYGDTRYVTLYFDGRTPVVTGLGILTKPLTELDNESRYADDWIEVKE